VATMMHEGAPDAAALGARTFGCSCDAASSLCRSVPAEFPDAILVVISGAVIGMSPHPPFGHVLVAL
jgi:hypothetical protein